MSEGLRITVLGDAGVWLGDDRLVFLTHRAELAVFCLALAGPSGLHQDVLIERLWPGAPADRGRARLRTVLWQVRVALGGEAGRIERRGRAVHMRMEGLLVDLVGVRKQADALLRHGARRDPDQLDKVVSELNRPILVGWQYEPWVEAEAEHNAHLLAALHRRDHP